MTETANLGLPFIDGGQAQKHVTHNEALCILDDAIQIAVLDTTQAVPPEAPADGERYIVPSGAGGPWAGRGRAIAVWETNAWRFLVPKAGWCVWSIADGALLVFDGSIWIPVTAGGGTPFSPDNLPHLGINTTAVETNLLTVRSDDVLFHAIETEEEGTGDMRLQLSKETAENTASVVFSDAFSGRAEFGLTGDDDFHLKVSADGIVWRDALKFDRTTGSVSFPAGGAREILAADRFYHVRTDGSDSSDGLTSETAFKTIQKAVNTVAALDLSIYNVTIQLGAGTYNDGIVVNGPWVGSGVVLLQGDPTTPSNVLIGTTSADAIKIQNGAKLSVSGVKVRATTSGNGFYAIDGSVLSVVGKVECGACAGAHFRAEGGGANITILSPYAISGSATYHYLFLSASVIKCINLGTITLSGSPAFPGAFAYGEFSYLRIFGNTYSGAATGARYSITGNAVIQAGGAGANYFPGNAAGVVNNGSQYI